MKDKTFDEKCQGPVALWTEVKKWVFPERNRRVDPANRCFTPFWNPRWGLPVYEKSNPQKTDEEVPEINI